MQQIILIISAIIFVLAITKQILYWSWLWQLKEYRIDRLRAHFQDIGIKNDILIIGGYDPVIQNKKPEFTKKAALVFFGSFLIGIAALVLLVPYYFEEFSKLFEKIKEAQTPNEYYSTTSFFILFYLITPFFVFLSVTVFNFIGGFQKRRMIAQARRKIASLPNLTVIGITGSYGKSTTKEILFEILSKSQKFSGQNKILKTSANINTPIGIARLVLHELNEKHKIFIVEMGAYKIGEVKEICDMVKPRIGIITGINEQHLALFGSISKTIETKFELFDCLPEGGLAILNIGDQNVQAGLEEKKGAKVKTKLYSVDAKSDVYAANIATRAQSVYFKLISGIDICEFKVNLIGRHNISNALAAIIAANAFGISWEEISQILQRINQLSRMLGTMPGPNGSVLFHDIYNANPDGVLADLEYLKNQKGGKIIVMSSLIELGSAAHEIHKKIGKEISSIAKRLIFLDKYYLDDVKIGAKENKDSGIEIMYDKNFQNIAEYLSKELKPSDQVLFISRKAGKILELLIHPAANARD